MKLRILGCSGGISGSLRTTSMLLDEDVLIDAGTGVGDLSFNEMVKIDHVFVEIAVGKPDSGYAYEGPIEDLPRNISPAIIIAGLPGAMIKNISLENMEVKHPGGGNPSYAKILLEALDSVPEKPAAYPEFSMFNELPAWGIYIRHAQDVELSNVTLLCGKKDYRTAVVLDDVQHSHFISMDIREPGNKKSFYQYHSLGNIFK